MPPTSRVLIVEDDPDQFDAIALALEGDGYAVEHARDGAEALAVLERFKPDVVVTDLVMPGMSGEQLVRAIQGLPEPQPRVIIVSGLDTVAERCAALGAAGYLSKPFDLDALLNVVARAAAGGAR